MMSLPIGPLVSMSNRYSSSAPRRIWDKLEVLTIGTLALLPLVLIFNPRGLRADVKNEWGLLPCEEHDVTSAVMATGI